MPAPYRSRRPLFTAFVFLLLSASFPLFGLASAFVVAVGTPRDANLSSVIARAAGAQLQSEGIVASLGPAGLAASTGHGRLVGEAERAGADLLLVVRYAERGEELRLDFTLMAVKGGAAIGGSSQTVAFNLNLDAKVADAVRRLLEEPGIGAAVAALGRGPEKVPGTAAPAAPGTRAPAAGTPGGGAAGGGLPGPGGGPGTQGSAGAPPGIAFTLTARGEPLLLVGNASNYFRYGAGASVFSGVHFPVSGYSLEGGALTGALQLFPAAGRTAGRVYVFLGGPSVHVGTAGGHPVTMGLRTAAGAAIILAEPQGMAAEAKTDLFVRAGVAATVALHRSVVVGIEVGGLVVFEQRYPIVAFAPALTVGF